MELYHRSAELAATAAAAQKHFSRSLFAKYSTLHSSKFDLSKS